MVAVHVVISCDCCEKMMMHVSSRNLGYSLCDATNYCGVSNDCAAQKKDEYVKQKVKCDR